MSDSVAAFWAAMKQSEKEQATTVSSLLSSKKEETKTSTATSSSASSAVAAKESSGLQATPVPLENPDEVIQNLQRDMNRLSVDNRSERMQAMKALRSKLGLNAQEKSDKTTKDLGVVVDKLFPDQLLKPLLERFRDPVEAVRKMALQTLRDLLEVYPGPLASLLPYIFPILTDRIVPPTSAESNNQFSDNHILVTLNAVAPSGTVVHAPSDPTVWEVSEEMRLTVVELVGFILAKLRSDSEAIHPYLDDLVRICRATCSDGFAAVKKESCRLAHTLCDTVDASVMKLVAVPLLQALIPNLTHMHSSVRSQTAEVVRRLVLFCKGHEVFDSSAGGDTGGVALDMYPVLKSLVNADDERSASVRKIVLQMGKDWLSEWDERFGHEYKMFSLLIMGLGDPVPELQDIAYDAVEAAAQVYYDDKLRQEQSETAMHAQPSEARSDYRDAAMYSSLLTESSENPVSRCELYPGVIQRRGRPSFVARTAVRHFLSKIIDPCIVACTNWNLNSRASSVEMITNVIAYAEDYMTQFVNKLFPIYCRIIGDDDPRVRSSAECALQLLGHIVPGNVSIPIALNGFRPNAPELNTAALLLHLKAILCLLNGIDEARSPLQAEVGDKALQTLSSSTLITSVVVGSSNTELKELTLQVVNRLMECSVPISGGSVDDPRVLRLYLLALRFYSSSGDQHYDSIVDKTIRGLALCMCQYSDLGTWVCDMFSDALMKTCARMDGWSKHDHDVVLFNNLIKQAIPFLLVAGSDRFPELDAVIAAISSLCNSTAITEVDVDPGLRLCLLRVLLVILDCPHMSGSEWEGYWVSDNRGIGLLESVLVPNLRWRAGPLPSLVRQVSLRCMRSMIMKALLQPDVGHIEDLRVSNGGGDYKKPTLFSGDDEKQVLPCLFSCLDDDEHETRALTCELFSAYFDAYEQVLSLSPDFYYPILPELLKRLDDSLDAIRLTACRTIATGVSQLSPTFSAAHAEHIVKVLFIHLDDPNPEIQVAVFCVLESCLRCKCTHFVELVGQHVEKSRSLFRSQEHLNKLAGML